MTCSAQFGGERIKGLPVPEDVKMAKCRLETERVGTERELFGPRGRKGLAEG